MINFPLTTNRLILTAAVIWIAVLTASLTWNWHHVDKTTMGLAENAAKAYFEKDIAYRHWAAMHGGVYVPVTETTRPNPYLDIVPDRDVTTKDGKKLTLVNPSYMTRQVHELGLEYYGMLGHITSLDPIRPENAADEWETRALLTFEEGSALFSSVETMNGQPYLRSMMPLITQESCLGCHTHQGYTSGDIRGGISVSVPWGPYLSQAGSHKSNLALAHAFIGILGLLGLWTGQRLLRGSELKLLESKEQKAATLHSIGDGVVSCDKSGRIQDLNPAAEKLMGQTLEESLERPLEEVFNIVALHDHSREENPVSRVLQQGRIEDKDTYSVLISRNGRKITIKMSCAPIRDNSGSITGAVLVFRDVTREQTTNLLIRKRLELYEYAEMHSLDDLMTKVLDDAEEFVDSSIGFFHFVEKDQKTLSLQRWSTRSLQELCHIPGNKMHYPIDQAGVWIQAALEKKPVIHNDYESIPDKKGLPKGHARVVREIVVPVIRDNKVVAIMGLGNKPVDYDEKDIEIISFFAGITWGLVEHKRTQEALQNSEARLKTITDAAPDGIIMMDAQGSVSYWNPAAETILGHTRDEAMNKNLHQLIMPSRYIENFEASFPEFQKTGQGNAVGMTTELYALTKNGREIPVELSLSSVLINEAWHAIGIIRDITEKKEAQEELQRNARNLEIKNAELDAARIKAEEATRAKSEFLANMSHEIRTPMNGVIGMTGLLLDTNLSRKQTHYANTVRSSAEALLTVINDILDFSKIEAGRLDLETIDFDLEDMLRDFTGMMAVKAEEKDLELICSIALDVPFLVRGDPGRLRQILLNLVGNAIKFTEHGEVEIRLQQSEGSAEMPEYRHVETDKKSAAMQNSGTGTTSGRPSTGSPDVTCPGDITEPASNRESDVLLHFTIRDTGIGIPENKIGLLFDKFSQVDASTTRKFGGTGLGLAISRQLAELMGGRVGLESVEGKGSTFWFTVRLGLQEDQQQKKYVPVCLQGVRTLIVDDNPTNREILRVRLGSWHMRPEEAVDGPSALNMLHQARADNDPFVVAILDMMMPDMDGETLGRIIKEDEQLKNTILIMMSSATGQPGDAGQLQQAGFNIVLSKPVLPSELHAGLENILAKTGRFGGISEYTQQEKIRKGYVDFSSIKARILLAEDNVVNQQVALGILEIMGLRTDVVANGQEAIHAIKTLPYDLVLMDVQMPEMDGLEATKKIRRLEIPPAGAMTDTKPSGNSNELLGRNAGIPIIAMTAAAMLEDRKRCFEAGMNDYIAKPVNPEELARVLHKWLIKEPVKGEPEASGGKQAGQNAFPCTKPVFDKDAFMTRMFHDKDLAEKILNIFQKNLPESLKSLKAFIEQGHKEDAIRQAHSIKGNSGNTGCLAMSEIAALMEEAGHSDKLEQMKELLPELERQFAKCRAEIRKTMSG